MLVQAAESVFTPPLARGQAEHRFVGLAVRLRRIEGLTAPGVLTQPFQFQAAPINTFPINRSYPQTTFDTLSGQQHSRPGVHQLKSVSYQSIFTDMVYSWTQLYGDRFVPDPLAMLAELERIAESDSYFWLTVKSPRMERYDVNWPASLTDLNSEEREGEPDARYTTVAFLEYRDSALRSFRIGGGPRGNITLPTTVRVGDLPAAQQTLHGLAQFYYGDPTMWPRIAKANGLTFPPSVNFAVPQGAVVPGTTVPALLDTNRRLTIPAR